MNRLQKFVEKGAAGPARVAYAFGAERLPQADTFVTGAAAKGEEISEAKRQFR